MYVYLVANRVEDNENYVYEQLEVVCANRKIAEREEYALRKREGYKKDTNEVAIWKMRVNNREKVFVLRETYNLCGIDIYMYRNMSTSLKRMEGYKKHLVQMPKEPEANLTIKEFTVLQA